MIIASSTSSSAVDSRNIGAEALGHLPTAFAASPWIDASRTRTSGTVQLEIAIIDDRPLMRDCFGRSLTMIEPSLTLRNFSTIDDLEAADGEEISNVQIILLCVMWSKARASTHFADIARLSAAHPSADVILLSDIEDLNDILKAIESGARGYVPTSVSLEVAVKAMQLVAAGGVYIPASVLFWSDKIIKEISQSTKQKQQPDTIFTSRQSSVMEALRRGKANKIIAYELNMCESTVKVHIRNIMKKLKAKNRTEVAYILNNMILDENNVVRN